jgi:prevent-host-death family protein
MTTVTASRLRAHSSEVLGIVRFGNERVAITSHGREIAAVVPMDDVRLLEKLEEALDVFDALESIDEAEREGTISLAQLRQELGL